jgi:hypothetical protein
MIPKKVKKNREMRLGHLKSLEKNGAINPGKEHNNFSINTFYWLSFHIKTIDRNLPSFDEKLSSSFLPLMILE